MPQITPYSQAFPATPRRSSASTSTNGPIKVFVLSCFIACGLLLGWFALSERSAGEPVVTLQDPPVAPELVSKRSESLLSVESAIAAVAEPNQDSLSPSLVSTSQKVIEEDALIRKEMREKLDSDPSPKVSAFLSLAHAYELEKDLVNAHHILDRGLKTHPSSTEILLEKSDVLARAEDFQAAWTLLAKTGLIENQPFASRILQYGVEAALYDETLVILSGADRKNFEWSPADWKAIVSLYENTGQIERALEVARTRLDDKLEVERLLSAMQ